MRGIDANIRRLPGMQWFDLAEQWWINAAPENRELSLRPCEPGSTGYSRLTIAA